MEQYYNKQRLHSALGYRTPEEFERQAQCQNVAPDAEGATITFAVDLAQSTTGMLEQGTQTPSPAPDLIPAEEIIEAASMNPKMGQPETVSVEGFNKRTAASVPI